MKIAIIGTVGVPAHYGGFETLAENLVVFAHQQLASSDKSLTVYCSGRGYSKRSTNFLGARLRYSHFNANGAQSVLYDAFTAIDAALRGHDRLLFLGVSGAVIIPLLRLFTRAKIVTNVDGIEWRREKWKGFARRFLQWSEAIAVRYSHAVIADNQGIADYLKEKYGVQAEVIAYGGDHALSKTAPASNTSLKLPQNYALALCRIEPENNVEMILEAFSGQQQVSLVFVGNWENSEFGRKLYQRFKDDKNINLLAPIYDIGELRYLRESAAVYVHGHSAGGTNPSLVEMMHFGIPVMAFDCTYNRHTTDNKAAFFQNPYQLQQLISHLDQDSGAKMGAELKQVAQERYTWAAVGKAYFELLERI